MRRCQTAFLTLHRPMWRRHSCLQCRDVSTPVRGRDAVSKASVGMSADVAGRSACATSLPPNIAEDHAAHLLTQTFDIFRIGGAAEAFGEVEEFLLFALLSLHAVFDEFQ